MTAKALMRPVLVLLLITLSSCSHSDPEKKQENRLDVAGTWKVAPSKGSTYTMTLSPDGSGIQSRPGAFRHAGSWKRDGDRTVIYWSDGWIDVIAKTGEALIQSSYAPGSSLQENPAFRSTLTREKQSNHRQTECKQQKNRASWSHRLVKKRCCLKTLDTGQ